MDKPLTGYRKISGQPLRVYRDSSDKTGTVLCRSHRDSFYALHPAASGAGEFGGQCEQCLNEGADAGERPAAAKRSQARSSSRAQRALGHLSAGGDYEQARQLGHALQHYLAALNLAAAADRPTIQEAIGRVSGALGQK
jgi:hypothetical protein